jgi:hypothetical protein
MLSKWSLLMSISKQSIVCIALCSHTIQLFLISWHQKHSILLSTNTVYYSVLILRLYWHPQIQVNVLGKVRKFLNNLRNFLHSRVSLYLFGPDILLSTVFETPSLYTLKSRKLPYIYTLKYYRNRCMTNVSETKESTWICLFQNQSRTVYDMRNSNNHPNAKGSTHCML